MEKRLYVGNLAYDATEDDLRDLFAGVGAVKSVMIIKDRETGRSKGFAFVEMETAEAAQSAVSKLHGQNLKDRPLAVNEARPRGDRPPGGGRPRNDRGERFPASDRPRGDRPRRDRPSGPRPGAERPRTTPEAGMREPPVGPAPEWGGGGWVDPSGGRGERQRGDRHRGRDRDRERAERRERGARRGRGGRRSRDYEDEGE